MLATINTVGSIDRISENTLLVEVMTNNYTNEGLQFYYLNNNDNNLNYTSFGDFNNKLKNSLRSNKTFYITFCGINSSDPSIPDYFYLVFSGRDIRYKGYVDEGGRVFLEFIFDRGNILEDEISSLFTNNVGVFIQAFL